MTPPESDETPPPSRPTKINLKQSAAASPGPAKQSEEAPPAVSKYALKETPRKGVPVGLLVVIVVIIVAIVLAILKPWTPDSPPEPKRPSTDNSEVVTE